MEGELIISVLIEVAGVRREHPTTYARAPERSTYGAPLRARYEYPPMPIASDSISLPGIGNAGGRVVAEQCKGPNRG
jgi:hypothetical protein